MSEEEEDEVWIICGSDLKDHVLEIPGTTVDNCHKCARPVKVAPSTMDRRDRIGAKLTCVECYRENRGPGPEMRILPEQRAEILKHFGPKILARLEEEVQKMKEGRRPDVF